MQRNERRPLLQPAQHVCRRQAVSPVGRDKVRELCKVLFVNPAASSNLPSAAPRLPPKPSYLSEFGVSLFESASAALRLCSGFKPGLSAAPLPLHS